MSSQCRDRAIFSSFFVHFAAIAEPRVLFPLYEPIINGIAEPHVHNSHLWTQGSAILLVNPVAPNLYRPYVAIVPFSARFLFILRQ